MARHDCAQCGCTLDPANYAIAVQHGIIGQDGDFIPLDNKGLLLFCSEQCVKEYFDSSSLPKMKRRIP